MNRPYGLRMHSALKLNRLRKQDVVFEVDVLVEVPLNSYLRRCVNHVVLSPKNV